MNRFLKFIAIFFTALLLLIAIGVYYIVNNVDPNHFKAKISARVNTLTQQQLTIRGNISWSLFPSTFEADDLVLNNNQTNDNIPLAHIGKAQVSVHLLPLLFGKIDIRSIILDQVDINLRRQPDGHTNWYAYHPIQINNKTIDFNIASLTLIHGNVVYQDNKNKKTWQANNIFFRADNFGTEQVFPITSTFTLMTPLQKHNLKVQLTANGNIDNRLQTAAINDVSFKTNQINIDGNFTSTLNKTKPDFQGNISIHAMDPHQLSNNFNLTIPTLHNPKALTYISSQFAFSGNMDAININPLKIKVDQTDFTGNMTIQAQNNKLHFALVATQLNLDDYVPVTMQNINMAPENIYAPSFILNGSVTVNELTAARLHLSDANIALNAENGVWQFPSVTANFYEGKMTGSAMVDLHALIPHYTVHAGFSNCQIGNITNDLLNQTIVDGNATVDLALTTQGQNITDLKQNLSGKINLTIDEGSLKKIDIKSALQQADGVVSKKSNTAAALQATSFNELKGLLSINQAVATFENVVLNSADFTATVTGQANFNQQIFDLALNVHALNDPLLKNYTVPIKVTDNFFVPTTQLNVALLQQQINTKTRLKNAR